MLTAWPLLESYRATKVRELYCIETETKWLLFRRSAFFKMKMDEFRLKFHWSLFLGVQLTIFQHWFRWWHGADQATSEPMVLSLLVHICITRLQWVKCEQWWYGSPMTFVFQKCIKLNMFQMCTVNIWWSVERSHNASIGNPILK